MPHDLPRWRAAIGRHFWFLPALIAVAVVVAGATRADAQALPVETAELCENKPDEKEVGCWQTLQQPPGCRFWGWSAEARRTTVSWTGSCSDGVVQGAGTLTSQPLDRKRLKRLLRGDTKKRLFGVRRIAGVEDRLRWTRNVEFPAYVNGQWHGTEVWRDADGTPYREIPYVAGEKHGTEVWGGHYDGDGHSIAEIPWVNGKKHGTEVWRIAGDDLPYEETPYVNGKKHGMEVWRFDDGAVKETPYVNGKRHGTEVWRFASGRVTEQPWVNDEPGETLEVQQASKQRQERPERRGRWARVAAGVLGGAAIADAGEFSEAAVEAGIDFAAQVIGDEDAAAEAAAEAAATSPQGLAGETTSPLTGDAPMSDGNEAACGIPGFLDGTIDMDSAADLGLPWCPAHVDIQRRAFALQAEAIRCRLSASPPVPNRAEAVSTLRSTCEALAAMNERFGATPRCQCPEGYGSAP